MDAPSVKKEIKIKKMVGERGATKGVTCTCYRSIGIMRECPGDRLTRRSGHVDPVLFKATNGRLTIFGLTAFPMVTITMIGRTSGKARSVHLAAIEDEGEQLVVASSMGREKHPGWRYNLEANPDIQVQAEGKSYRARAEVLSDREKEKVWSKIRESIPQIAVYETRTNRNIRVFRLRRV